MICFPTDSGRAPKIRSFSTAHFGPLLFGMCQMMKRGNPQEGTSLVLFCILALIKLIAPPPPNVKRSLSDGNSSKRKGKGKQEWKDATVLQAKILRLCYYPNCKVREKAIANMPRTCLDKIVKEQVLEKGKKKKKKSDKRVCRKCKSVFYCGRESQKRH